MNLTGIQRVQICARFLTRGTVLNRYHYYRFIEERSPVSAAVRAIVSRVWFGV